MEFEVVFMVFNSENQGRVILDKENVLVKARRNSILVCVGFFGHTMWHVGILVPQGLNMCPQQ